MCHAEKVRAAAYDERQDGWCEVVSVVVAMLVAVVPTAVMMIMEYTKWKGDETYPYDNQF